MSSFKSINALTKSHYTFEGIQEGEEVVLFLHRHKLTLILKLIGVTILVALPLILYRVIGNVLDQIGVYAYALFLFSLYFLLIWSMFIKIVTMYLLDYWIVTNRRILSNTQHGFFNRIVSEMQFSRVQDVSVKISGLLETAFNFGEVDVQSAGTGTTSKFLFKQVARPHEIKDKIMALVEQKRAER